MIAHSRFMVGVLALAGLLMPAVATAQDVARSISVSGESAVFVVPDEVIIDLGVEIDRRDLSEARAEIEKASQSAIKAIRSLGIEEKHIQVDKLRINIIYNSSRTEKGDRHFTYNFAQNFTIVVKDTAQFDKVITTALDNGANVIHNFEFRTTELRKHRDEARAMAMRAAREKAQALAAELGCEIGAPRSISERGFNYYGRNSNNPMTQNSLAIANTANTPEGQELPLGQIGISASVSIVFDLIVPVENAATE